MAAFDLTGRTVLVAGASSGIGAHFSGALAEAGAAVVLGARRTDKTGALADELRARGLRAMAVPMDVTEEASVVAAFDQAEAGFGTIHSVIANAGTVASGKSTDLPIDAVAGVIGTNYLCTYIVAREAAKRMIAAGSRESGFGRVLLISSITSHQNISSDTAYASSKAAVNHLGRCLALEWIRLGINVNIICPGYMRTELTESWIDGDFGKKFVGGFHRKRLLPEDGLDDMVLFYCSDASRYLTGSVIDIDDGQSL
jgi:NAD(P)-dependent dehydrogenase (short-subunit alcohol dehydrogenase family)